MCPHNQPRILFLNPPDPKGCIWMKEVGRCGRRSISGEVWPQTGLAYLAAMARREGAMCRIVDAMATPLALEEVSRLACDWQPNLIVANSATPTVLDDGAALCVLKKATGALVGFVGPHVSALPESTLVETSVDFGLINEAEETIAEVTRRLCDGAREPDALFSGVAGMVYRNAGQTVVAAERSLISDLDSLPLPARDLLPNEAYHLPFFRRHPFATIIPSRGCPWPCSFCRAGRVWGRKPRLRSVEGVLDEVRHLDSVFGVRHIVFMTDSLTLKRDWAVALLDGLAALPDPPEWICNSRVDVVDLDMLKKMRAANCQMISYGLETGAQAILDRSRKGITLEQSRRAIALTREAGIPSMAYFIFGLPGETRETMEATLRFAHEVRPDYVNFHVATPFPGTPLFEEAEARGWLSSRDWKDYEQEGAAVLDTGVVRPEDLRRMQVRAMRSFYFRPRRLLQELCSVRDVATLKSRLRAGLKLLRLLAGKS